MTIYVYSIESFCFCQFSGDCTIHKILQKKSCRGSLFFYRRNAKDKHDDMRRPHDADRNACVRRIGHEKGDAHEHGNGEHDAQFLDDGHAAPSAVHEKHRLSIDVRGLQPAIEAMRPARKAPGREQDERHGRQDGEEGAEDAEPETDEAERDK